MRSGRAAHLGAQIVIAAVALAAILETAAAWEGPSADEIVRKFLAIRASAPRILAANVSVALRSKAPLTAEPNCIYEGVLRPSGTEYVIRIEHEIRKSLICGLADPHRENLLAVVRQTLEAVAPLPERAKAIALRMDRFELAVRDQKVEGVGQRTDWLYLLEGMAKDPNTDPKAFRGWFDYDEGVWEEGTLTYSWGQVDTRLKYTYLENTWMLTYQYLYSKKYDASLEAVFSNFQFSP